MNWFELVKSRINKFGILREETYNFDEISFQIGQIHISKPVISEDRLGRSKQVKPTNSERVTLIQRVRADGTSVLQFVIIKSKEIN